MNFKPRDFWHKALTESPTDRKGHLPTVCFPAQVATLSSHPRIPPWIFFRVFLSFLFFLGGWKNAFCGGFSLMQVKRCWIGAFIYFDWYTVYIIAEFFVLGRFANDRWIVKRAMNCHLVRSLKRIHPQKHGSTSTFRLIIGKTFTIRSFVESGPGGDCNLKHWSSYYKCWINFWRSWGKEHQFTNDKKLKQESMGWGFINSHQTILWWLNQPMRKICSSNWIISAGIRGVQNKNYEQNHQPDIKYLPVDQSATFPAP